ncbi:hypothetical protein I4I77_29925, partial [Pseudonocardia sp. KRD-188]|nr:hypothetical protein [Pseudonocardia oceani]
MGWRGPGFRHSRWCTCGDGDDRIFGQAGSDAVRGEGGDDALVGGDDNDALDGGSGTNTVDGGPGRDADLGRVLHRFTGFGHGGGVEGPASPALVPASVVTSPARPTRPTGTRRGAHARRARAAGLGALLALGTIVAVPGVASAQLPAGCTQTGQTVTCTYASTGAAQTFTVPTGVSTVRVVAVGGRGGGAAETAVFTQVGPGGDAGAAGGGTPGECTGGGGQPGMQTAGGAGGGGGSDPGAPGAL